MRFIKIQIEQFRSEDKLLSGNSPLRSKGKFIQRQNNFPFLILFSSLSVNKAILSGRCRCLVKLSPFNNQALPRCPRCLDEIVAQLLKHNFLLKQQIYMGVDNQSPEVFFIKSVKLGLWR